MTDFSDKKKVPMKGGTVFTPDGSTPTPETLSDGQHKDHWVLPDEERAKGFVRPVRRKYRHVGPPASKYQLRDLTDDERRRYAQFDYVKFEPYPEDRSPLLGRYWTQAELDAVAKPCGAVTSMPLPIAETYARDPKYYGQTFCCGCGKYLRVGPDGEFVWEGTTERVGT